VSVTVTTTPALVRDHVEVMLAAGCNHHPVDLRGDLIVCRRCAGLLDL
jgi:hypothetical protein